MRFERQMRNDRQGPHNSRRSSLSSPAAVQPTLERVLNELPEQVVDAPVATGAGVQRTVEQIIDVPDDAEEQAQQRPVEQIVSVATETTIQATATLDRAELDVTQQVTPRVQAKAAPKAAPMFECSLRRSTRLECERVRYQEQAKWRFKRARERSAASSARRAPFRRSGFSGP